MNCSSLSKLIGAGVIAVSLTVLPLTKPAQAQDNAPQTYTQPDGDVEAYETENDFDWGWLGLLGLAGLAGLAGRKRPDTVNYTTRDPNVGVRSASEYH
ncbi:MAG TPA: hypothetical protein DCL61_18535 [Cyanobacteria bacterium UBA12227]|nr:hypothetical protein [Cyanobacteria bacterium UBA12227]HAX89445.1 hypothetical protein [Cyanobacteria bacterium UBA11370]